MPGLALRHAHLVNEYGPRAYVGLAYDGEEVLGCVNHADILIIADDIRARLKDYDTNKKNFPIKEEIALTTAARDAIQKQVDLSNEAFDKLLAERLKLNDKIAELKSKLNN